MKNFFSLVVGIILLLGGYMLGASWSAGTDDPNSTKQIQQEGSSDSDSDHNLSLTEGEEETFDLKPNEKATIALFQEAAPSVVFITTSTFEKDYFTMDVAEIQKGSGSGFIWDTQGHIARQRSSSVENRCPSRFA